MLIHPASAVPSLAIVNKASSLCPVLSLSPLGGLSFPRLEGRGMV